MNRDAIAPHLTRRAFLAGGLGLLLCSERRYAHALTDVPIDLQVQLVKKAAVYDRNMQARAGQRLTVLAVYTESIPESTRAHAQLIRAFEGRQTIAGLPVDVVSEELSEPQQLISALDRSGAAIVCLTDGLDAFVPGLAEMLVGKDVLTCSTSGRHVQAGVVLGFKAVSARPRILVNLAQAKRQNVAFRSEFLRLAEVIR